MHIGLIGPSDPDTFVDNIRDSLTSMGHQVSLLGSTRVGAGGTLVRRAGDLVQQALPCVEGQLHQRIVRKALEHECDAVINTVGDLAPDAIGALRRERVPVALWFPDPVTSMGRQWMVLAPYTAMFFKDPLLVQRLRDVLGLPVHYLPEACNPRWHRPQGQPARRRVIALVGNTYPGRLMLLRRLHAAGIPLMIRGAAAPRWATAPLPPGTYAGREVTREKKAAIFRSAAGVLNSLRPAEMSGVNCRLFEAAGSGGAVLCERRPVLSDLFDSDREVVPFTDFAELRDRCRQLLGNPRLSEEIGDAGSKRAHAEHTYELRLTTLLARIL